VSEIAQAATVSILVADFASNDAIGKGNIVGAGVAGLGFDPQQGLTSRFTLWISVHIPTSLCPAEFPLETALVDVNGQLVNLPGPFGSDGQPLRVAQLLQAEKPNMTFNAAQRDHLGSRMVVAIDFGSGLPLAPGGLYTWRIRLDGDDTRTWEYPIAVAGPPTAPIIG
jgi:hypothetical protein